MADPDKNERIALSQVLMVEISARLEDLATLAADQQLSRTHNPALLDGLAAVHDLVQAHSRLLPPARQRPIRAKSKT